MTGYTLVTTITKILYTQKWLEFIVNFCT